MSPTACVTLEPADRLWHVAHLAWRTIPYAFAPRAASAGPVAFELAAPSGGSGPSDATAPPPSSGAPATTAAWWRAGASTPADTSLRPEGPDGDQSLVRTWA